MSAGQPYELFWRLTLREISLILEGEQARFIREHDERAWVVWHIEALSRSGKKFPPLKKMLYKQARKKRQTVDEQVAIAQAWTAALGRR